MAYTAVVCVVNIYIPDSQRVRGRRRCQGVGAALCRKERARPSSARTHTPPACGRTPLQTDSTSALRQMNSFLRNMGAPQPADAARQLGCGGTPWGTPRPRPPAHA